MLAAAEIATKERTELLPSAGALILLPPCTVTGSNAAAIFGAGLHLVGASLANQLSPEDIELVRCMLSAMGAFAACRGLALDMYIKIAAVSTLPTESCRRLLAQADSIFAECDRVEAEAIKCTYVSVSGAAVHARRVG